MTLRLNGATSGSVSIDAPATGSNVTLELPTDSIKPGLVLVAAQSFSAVSSVSVNNCFSGTYRNYRILISYSATAFDMLMRFRSAGSDVSTNNHARTLLYVTNSASGSQASTLSSWQFASHNSGVNIVALDVFGPALSAAKYGLATLYAGDSSFQAYGFGGGPTTAMDGLSLISNSGTLTGTLRVYGYRDSL